MKIGKYLGIYDKQCVPGGVVAVDNDGGWVRSDTIRRLSEDQAEDLKGKTLGLKRLPLGLQ